MNNPEPPEELVNKKFDFVGIHFDSEVDLNHPKTLSMPYSNGSWVPSKQTFIEDLDIVFWVFLDNADEDRVHHKVLFNVSARIDPGEFLGDPAPAKNGSHKLNGLYQAMFNIDINPKGLDESAITWAASAPQSVNQEITQTESVTDSFSFDIGYKVAKVSRSWTYQFGRSYAVKQWNLVETGMGKKMGWKFWQKLPWDGLTGGENIDHTQVPDLSRYSTQFFAQGLWKTTRQIKGIVDFEVIIQHQPQGIFTLPKIAMPTQETIRQTHTLAVDFSKVK